jgi:hypothetical protein
MIFYLSSTKAVDLRTIAKLKILIVDQLSEIVVDDKVMAIFEQAKRFANGEIDQQDLMAFDRPKEDSYTSVAFMWCAKVGDPDYDHDCILAASRSYAFNVDDFAEVNDRRDAFMVQSADIIRAEVPNI